MRFHTQFADDTVFVGVEIDKTDVEIALKLVLIGFYLRYLSIIVDNYDS
jgi:hypothetical protein